LVLFDDLLWKDADREAHVLVARHRGVEIEVFDIRAHETGVGVEMTLLKRILAVVMSAVGVLTSPG
jgi:hypothetical protein